MARPQSRSGMLGPAPVPATLRPGSMAGGFHGGFQGGMGPFGGMPPGTANRMMASRQGQGTASRRQGTGLMHPMVGVGAMTDVQVTERPTTMQGMEGMKTGTVGPKRQVYDKSYFMLELRKRCGSLREEVAKMNKEINDIQQENQLYATLEKRYDTLVRTVRQLEGDLADHNLATDKLRTDTAPEEVHHMYMIMKVNNEEQRQEVDQIFLEKKSHEEEVQKMQAECDTIARAAEERLNELHPDQRHEYEQLREENNSLGRELAEGREELEQVSNRFDVLEGHLRSDVLRARSQQLLEVRQEVGSRLAELTEEVRQCSMSVPEQRELLLTRVKNDNAEIVAAEKRNSELKMEKERLRTQIKEVTTDAQERKEEGSDQQKYEILFAKDQEMTQFIASFDEHKGEEEAKMRQKQDAIVRLLENISSALALRSDLTPEGHLRDMEDELNFKQGQLHNSENTQNRLEGELAKRQGELEKIESLDMKIAQELQQVEQKMAQYEEDIAQKYDRVEEMRAARTEELRRLEARKQALEGRVAAMKQQVSFLRVKYDSRRQQLADDETAAALEAQEQTIQRFGQTLFTLSSFIKKSAAETDFDSEMANCLSTATELNKMLQDRRPQIA